MSPLSAQQYMRATQPLRKQANESSATNKTAKMPQTSTSSGFTQALGTAVSFGTLWLKRISWGAVFAPEPISTTLGIIYLAIHLFGSLISKKAFPASILDYIGFAVLLFIVIAIAAPALLVISIIGYAFSDPISFAQDFGSVALEVIYGSF